MSPCCKIDSKIQYQGVLRCHLRNERNMSIIDCLLDISEGNEYKNKLFSLSNQKLIAAIDDAEDGERSLIDYLFLDINIINFEKERESVIEFSDVALNVASRFLEYGDSDLWVIKYAFIKHCIESEDFPVANKAMKYLAAVIEKERVVLFKHVSDENLIDMLLSLLSECQESFETKSSIINLIYSILKNLPSRSVYEMLILSSFLQNALFMLDEEDDDKCILTILEIIFMLYQQAVKIGDESSISTIIEESGYVEKIQELMESDTEEIAAHSRELVEIFWPDLIDDDGD